MSFPSYNSYRDSGVDWISDVPTGWSVCPLGYRYEVALGKMLDEGRIVGDRLAPYLRNVDVQWDRINVDGLPEMDFAASETDRYGLRVGDLLVCEGGEVGRAAMWTAEIDGCFYQKALHRLRPRNPPTDVPRFLFYVLRAATSRDVFTAGSGKATIAHLPAEAFRRYRFPFPPPSEQADIAAFLDRETGKIDALVETQRRLIELLKEKRQAVISHAVIKGLDPTAPMKDSGVGWLGEVPAHWEVKPLKRVATVRYGIGEPPPYHDVGTPLIRATNVDAGRINAKGLVYVDPRDIPEKRIVWLSVGDIVVVRSGAYTGDSAIIDQSNIPCIAGFDMVASAFGCHPLYLQFCLLSRWVKEGQIDLEKMRAAQPHLNAEELGEVLLALPPAQEQVEISERLSCAVASLDELSGKSAAAIALLQERRAALISAAVTGKIDVRGLVPEQAEAA